MSNEYPFSDYDLICKYFCFFCVPSHDLDKIILFTTSHWRHRLKTAIIVLTIDQRSIIAHKIQGWFWKEGFEQICFSLKANLYDKY